MCFGFISMCVCNNRPKKILKVLEIYWSEDFYLVLFEHLLLRCTFVGTVDLAEYKAKENLPFLNRPYVSVKKLFIP